MNNVPGPPSEPAAQRGRKLRVAVVERISAGKTQRQREPPEPVPEAGSRSCLGPGGRGAPGPGRFQEKRSLPDPPAGNAERVRIGQPRAGRRGPAEFPRVRAGETGLPARSQQSARRQVGAVPARQAQGQAAVRAPGDGAGPARRQAAVRKIRPGPGRAPAVGNFGARGELRGWQRRQAPFQVGQSEAQYDAQGIALPFLPPRFQEESRLPLPAGVRGLGRGRREPSQPRPAERAGSPPRPRASGTAAEKASARVRLW